MELPMDAIRRIASVLMLVCLVLPQRACVYERGTRIYYPLSQAEDAITIVLVVALFILPVVMLVFRIRTEVDLVVGLIVGLAGLWHEGYGAWRSSSYVLFGWYLYVAATLTYVSTTAVFLLRRFRTSSATDLPERS